MAGLAGLTLLSLASAAWSGAPARAATAGSRDLLYLAVFATLATLPGPVLAPAARGLLAAIAAVVAIALATQAPAGALPAVARTRRASGWRSRSPTRTRSACSPGSGCCWRFTWRRSRASRERRACSPLRPCPPLISALYLTQSRGAIAAVAVGLFVWLGIGRSRWMLAGLAAVAGPALVALAATYAAVELVSSNPSAAATSQGRAVAAVLLACTVLAAWLRSRVARGSSWLAARRLPRVGDGVAVIGLVAGLLLAGAAGGVALVQRADEFRSPPSVAPTGDPRSRLVQFSSSGRLDLWRGAAEMFESDPVLGRGADTFQTGWELVRGNTAEATEAHSLYFETLAELGIAGLVLVVGTLAGVLACGLSVAGSRIGRATAVGVAVAWMAHAAVDWDWEMPAVTAVLFALAGAARPGAGDRATPAPGRALAAAALLVVAAAAPGAWAVSQARSDRALASYEAGDCTAALQSADGALDLTPFRPEALFVRAACLVRARRPDEALAAARAGVHWDRADFRGAYDAAAVTAAVGGDGRAEARRANSLNRLGPYSNWLPYWLEPLRGRPPQLIAGLAPMLLGGEAYPPVLRPYASPPS